MKKMEEDELLSSYKNNPMNVRWSALIIGFLMNVIGNSLTVVSSAGAEPVTAAAQNLSKVTGSSIGSFVILFGLINILLNQIILSDTERQELTYYQEHRRRVLDMSSSPRRFVEHWTEFMEQIKHTFVDKGRAILELIYIFAFGYAIDWGVLLLDKMHINHVPYPYNIPLSFLGVILFCVAISIYQRANLFMHPNDDTSNLIRFHYLHGSAFWSQIVIIIPALIICGLCFPILGKVYSISYGTIFSILFNGIIVGLSDKFIWPKLVHNKQKRHTLKLSIYY